MRLILFAGGLVSCVGCGLDCGLYEAIPETQGNFVGLDNDEGLQDATAVIDGDVLVVTYRSGEHLFTATWKVEPNER
jgi:hypothetical protein